MALTTVATSMTAVRTITMRLGSTLRSRGSTSRPCMRGIRRSSREHDEPMYLYYYRARYYHTDLQRFISEDPIEFAGGDVNLYGYARNNPLTFIDPLGLYT